jgi:glycosyltransferase involved in cell wall biosynthesis
MIQIFKNIFTELALFQLVSLSVFGVLFFIRLLFNFLFNGKVLFRKKNNNGVSVEQPVSLILTVRNQEENLKNNLPGILSLENPNFEMVVVDDYSEDNSYMVLGLLKERYKRLKFSILNQDTRFSMKLAQNIALKAAEFDWVLTSPITLSGVDPNWLASMVKMLPEEKNVVVAYSGVVRGKGFFHHLFRIETYYQYLKSTAYILNGIPFVYSDENVAFRKSKYFEVGGYGQKIAEPYANLELIINLFIQKKSTTVLFEKETAIRKSEKISRADYGELLKKSIRIEKHLSGWKRFVLTLDEIGKLLFLPFAVLVIILVPELWMILVGMLGIKFMANLVIIKITQNRLNERKIFISSLVYDLVMPYIRLFYKWHFNRRSKKVKWRSKV